MQQILAKINQMAEQGILTKEINLTNRHLLWLFFVSQILFLLPFTAVDIYLTNNRFDKCLLANFTCPDIQNKDTCHRITAPFSLAEWLVIDGVLKITVLLIMLLLVCLDTEIHSNQLSILGGNFIRAFYLFEIGWTITASVLFWGNNNGFGKPAYLECKSPFQVYLFFLFVYTYVMIPINIFIGGLRPKFRNSFSRLDSNPNIGLTISVDNIRRKSQLQLPTKLGN